MLTLRKGSCLIRLSRSFGTIPSPFFVAPSTTSGFVLDKKFLAEFAAAPDPFGFPPLGRIVYCRTYSRTAADGSPEQWVDTVRRVVEGTFEVQKLYSERVLCTPWDDAAGQAVAQDMFRRIFSMKFLPPGRGLWAMGSPVVRERGLAAALNNCAFVSTDGLLANPVEPFTFLMEASMLGVGVGFDTKGAGSLKIFRPQTSNFQLFQVADSRESWVASLEALLRSYFYPNNPTVRFDYDAIRPAGAPLKGFGGFSGGSGPLRALHSHVRDILEAAAGQDLSVTNIVDIMNLIGKCVVAGNIRRSAEIAFGEHDCEEFLDLKNYAKNPHRAEFGWTSNNSVLAKLGMDYEEIAKRIASNGEPGVAWLENMRAYSRMQEPADHRDYRVAGGNPCLEQSLESMELCCLVETFPSRHESLEDFLLTLRSALLYSKTVTLMPTHWPKSNSVMLRNRRIGCSVSGVTQFLATRGIETMRQWLRTGYGYLRREDKALSERWGIPESIKLTSVKPSGTVSLLAGSTAGIHFPESRFCVRRVRLAKNNPLVGELRRCGFKVEDCVGDDSAVVVEIPLDHGPGVRSASSVSMWEQLSLAAFMQAHWADNQVSATVTFDPATEGPHLAQALNYFQYQLKSISFCPRLPAGAFPQMPVEALAEHEYQAMLGRLHSFDERINRPVDKSHDLNQTDAFCSNDSCSLQLS